MKRLALIPLLLCSCTTTVEDPAGGCETIAQCNYGYVCNADHQCIPEPPMTAIGRFECIPQDDIDAPGKTTVVANIGIQRLPLNGVVGCTFPGDGLFLVSMVPPAVIGGNDYKLNVVMPWTVAQQGGRIDMQRPAMSNEAYSANVARYIGLSFDRILGHSAGGYIQFDEPPVVGQPLTGYVEIPLEETPEGTVVGNPCERGMVDCSDTATVLSSAFCMRPIEGVDPHVPICSALCKTDADCEDYGGICITAGEPEGLCLRDCGLGCEEPLACETVTNEDRSICWKKL